MRRPLQAAGLVIALLIVPATISAQDCGDCDEQTDPDLGDLHQFPGGGDEYDCSVPPGHATHDCEDGDGTSWNRGSCDEKHDTCKPEFALSSQPLLPTGWTVELYWVCAAPAEPPRT